MASDATSVFDKQIYTHTPQAGNSGTFVGVDRTIVANLQTCLQNIKTSHKHCTPAWTAQLRILFYPFPKALPVLPYLKKKDTARGIEGRPKWGEWVKGFTAVSCSCESGVSLDGVFPWHRSINGEITDTNSSSSLSALRLNLQSLTSPV